MAQMQYFTKCPEMGEGSCQTAQAIFDRLHDAQNEGRYADVVAAATEILEICPPCSHAAGDKAGALVFSDHADTAEPLIDDLLAGGLDGDSRVLDLKGLARARIGGPEEGVAWFLRAQAADPDEHSPNCHLADALCRLKRYKEALPYARVARATEPDEDEATGKLCIALTETGKNEELVELARNCEGKNWNLATTVNFGAALNKVGKKHMSLRWYRLAMKEWPEEVAAVCQAGQISLQLNRFPTAIRLYKRLKKLDPENHGALSSLNLAQVYGEEMGDWARALNEIVEARVAHPDNKDIKGYLKHVTNSLTRAAGETAGESEKWRRRFEAIRDEHSSLREAVLEVRTAAEPGAPVAIALVEGEGQTIEFIQSYPDNAHELAKEIAAFSTSNDGTIFLGITDDGTISGIEGLEDITARDGMQNRIGGVASGPVKPGVQVRVSFPVHEGNTVVRIFVAKGACPVYYAGNVAYLRDIDRSRPAEPHEVEEFIRRSQAT